MEIDGQAIRFERAWTPRDYANAQREYQEAAQPILRQVTNLYALATPKITLFPDGSMTSGMELPPDLERALEGYKALLLELHRQCFAQFTAA